MKEWNLSNGIIYTQGNLEKIQYDSSFRCNEIIVNGQKIKVDVLILAQGVTPNTEF